MKDCKYFDVLSVEDQKETMIGTISELELRDISVDDATTVRAARKKISEVKYAVMLIDLRLPEVDNGEVNERAGLQLAEEIRQGALGDRNQNTKIFFVTAQGVLIERFKSVAIDSNPNKARYRGAIDKASSIFPFVDEIERIVTDFKNAEES